MEAHIGLILTLAALLICTGVAIFTYVLYWTVQRIEPKQYCQNRTIYEDCRLSPKRMAYSDENL